MSAKVTAKAVSQVQNQIPQFITEEFPLYEKFLKPCDWVNNFKGSV